MTHLDDGADLRAVMERALCDIDAPDRCGPAAVASGHRMRGRRRAAIALAGVGAVVLVAAVIVPALGGPDGSTADTSMANDPSAVISPSAAPPRLTGWWDAPGERMVSMLEATLPAGVSVLQTDTTSDGPSGEILSVGGLSGVLSTEEGPGSFQLLLYPPDLDPADVPSAVTSTDATGNESTTAYAEAGQSLRQRVSCRRYHDTCVPIRDASGAPLGRASSNVESGTLLYEVFLLGPDGGALNFTVMNSIGEKPGYEAPASELPPLTLGQLRDLAADPVWTSYVP